MTKTDSAGNPPHSKSYDMSDEEIHSARNRLRLIEEICCAASLYDPDHWRDRFARVILSVAWDLAADAPSEILEDDHEFRTFLLKNFDWDHPLWDFVRFEGVDYKRIAE